MILLRNRFTRVLYPDVSSDNVADVFAYDSNTHSLVIVGKEDRSAKIDSFREICSIKNKLMRFQNGDITALNSKQGFYADISGLPRDYNSLHNMVKSAMNEVKTNGFSTIPEYIQSLIDLENKNDVSGSVDNNSIIDNEKDGDSVE